MSNNSNGTSSRATSTELLQLVADRNSIAWQRFTDLYAPLVFHWCRRSQLSEEDAGDVIQEVFTSVSRRIDRFIEAQSDVATFRGWLMTITMNQVRDHYRKRGRQVSAQGGTDSQLQLADVWFQEPDDETEKSAVASLFQRAVELIRGEFAQKTWEAFWRATIDGENTADIAAELGMTANSVRQAKSRVLRRLRQELGENSRGS